MIHLLYVFVTALAWTLAKIALVCLPIAITGFVAWLNAEKHGEDSDKASWTAMGIVGFIELLIVCFAQAS